MNHELYKYMKMNRNNINNLYHTFWIYTLKQFKENNEETGLYFWLIKENNNYELLHHGINGLIKETINMSEEEKDILMNRLSYDGFKILITKKNNIILAISKKNIIKYIENKQEEKNTSKIPVSTFSEAKKRNKV